MRIKSLSLASLGLLVLPLFVFIGYMQFVYPLKPHCDLGNGLKGCTPYCEPSSYFDDGRPSGYVVTPCFHEPANYLQKLLYGNALVVYASLLIVLVIAVVVTKGRFLSFIKKVAIAPYYVLRGNLNNKNIVSKIFVFILLVPLVAEWAFGYYFIYKDLLSNGFSVSSNSQLLNHATKPLVVEENQSCDEKQSITNAKNCTLLVLRDDGGHGTGFSVANGFLLTNKHVVENAKKLTTWINGEEQVLQIWNHSPIYDLAVMKLPVNISTCAWFDSSRIDLAENLYAVGWPNNPNGDSTITKGIYSRTNVYEDGFEFIQTDAPINPGNSGGPLINKCGVVGINTIKESWSNEQLPRPLEGLGNALSSKSVIDIVNKLIDEGGLSEIPKSKKEYTLNSQIPSQSTIIDVNKIQDHLNNIITAKESWAKASGCSQEKLSQLIDSFNRQIDFSTTLRQRMIDKGGKASQDDLIMWDSIVKMSYESSSLATLLNASCGK